MSGISTKDVKTGGGLPKIIEPGNHVLKINAVRLEQREFMESDNGYYLILDTETKPIDGFEGFLIDKDNEDGPRYKGQIGSIKTNRYYYRDGQTKSGIVIKRDMEILKQIKYICIAADCLSWFDEADGKYDTIEEFVEAFNKAGLFKDKWFNFCVGGKEFERKNNYIGHDLFIPKLTRGKVGFEPVDAKPSKVLTFDPDNKDHLIKLDHRVINEFSGGEDIPVDDDLKDAPDFEL